MIDFLSGEDARAKVLVPLGAVDQFHFSIFGLAELGSRAIGANDPSDYLGFPIPTRWGPGSSQTCRTGTGWVFLRRSSSFSNSGDAFVSSYNLTIPRPYRVVKRNPKELWP